MHRAQLTSMHGGTVLSTVCMPTRDLGAQASFSMPAWRRWSIPLNADQSLLSSHTQGKPLCMTWWASGVPHLRLQGLPGSSSRLSPSSICICLKCPSRHPSCGRSIDSGCSL